MNLFEYNSRLPEKYRGQKQNNFNSDSFLISERKPSFSETFDAYFGYTYDRIGERIYDVYKYGRDPTRTGFYAKRDPNYNPFDDLLGYEEYAEYLTTNAVNAEHMQSLKNRIESNKQDRETLGNASLINQFAVGMFDPVNLIALPFGGPTIGIARSALRTGVGVGILQTGQEAIRAPFDPLNQPLEVPINIGMATLGGFLLGGAFSILPTRKASAIKKTKKNLDNFISHVGGIKAEEYLEGPKQINREPFKNITDEDLNLKLTNQDIVTKKLVDEYESVKQRFQDGEDVHARLVELDGQISDAIGASNPLKLETKLRIIDKAVQGEKQFKIAGNGYYDAFLYNLIPSPLRSVINNKNVTNKSKFYIMKLAGDSGMLTTLEQLGVSIGKSVHQLSSARNGKMYRVESNIANDWREHGRRSSVMTKLTYNFSDMSQRITNRVEGIKEENFLTTPREQQTLSMYIKGINYHRIMETPLSQLSEAQRRSIKTLDDYYKSMNDELISAGLLGSNSRIKKEISKLEKDLEQTKLLLTKSKGLRVSNKDLFTNPKAAFDPNIKEVIKPKYKFQKDFESILELRIKDLEERIAEDKSSLEFALDINIDEKKFSPRFYSKQKILDNRTEFENVLIKSFKENPFIFTKNKDGTVIKKQLSIEPKDLKKRAKEVTDNILGLNDEGNIDNVYQGFVGSKHLRHRQITASDKDLYPFLEDNPFKILRAYNQKVSPVLEFARIFEGKTLNDIRHEIYTDMIENKKSLEEAQKVFMKFKGLYDRIVGSPVKNPDKMSYRFSRIIRSFAQMNYLGKAVLSTISEPAKLFHDHDFKDVFKGFFDLIEAGTKGPESLGGLKADEVFLAGEGLDIVLQTTHMRLVDDIKKNQLHNDIFDKMNNAFFTVNGLAPITNLLKQWDGILRQHTLIKNSIKITEGTATQQERFFMRRYGIDDTMAFQIANAPWQRTRRGLYFANSEEWLNTKQFKHIADVDIRDMDTTETYWKGKKNAISFVEKKRNKKPILYLDKEAIYFDFENKKYTKPGVKNVKPFPDDAFNSKEDYYNFIKLKEVYYLTKKQNKNETKSAYENRIRKLAYTELQNQTQMNKETLEAFRSSLNSGVLNTILMGTPADKPLITDGVVYIPMRVAKRFGMKEDESVKGYARFENGILGLPFQFYSYSLAAVNKITGSFLQGQVKNRAVALVGAVGLAYLGQKLRTNEYTWDNLSYTDKFARAFDYSGLASLYTGLFYEAFHTAYALDQDISYGLLKPKYNVNADGPAETIVGISGAGPSIFFDFVSNSFTLATGKEIKLNKGGFDFIEGNRSNAASEITRSLPFATIPGIQLLTNEVSGTIKEMGD
tara:strand:- start:1609 stop:5637 length:4029 start_codon:yes stop_codon:yes gene_type:complete